MPASPNQNVMTAAVPEPAKSSVKTETTEEEHRKINWGLEGVVVTKTKVSTVGMADVALTYRGYPVMKLVRKYCFEEIAILLIKGELPTPNELLVLRKGIISGRRMGPLERAICENAAPDQHPMDIIRSASLSAVGGIPDEVLDALPVAEAEALRQLANFWEMAVMLGRVPSMACYHYNFHQFGRRIETMASIDVGVAEHYLWLLNRRQPTPVEIDVLDKTLSCYAEHDLNASTFAGRVTASTGADYLTCLGTAIGTLKGPLHGGANEAALRFIREFSCDSEVPDAMEKKFARKEVIMGFGHRVYKNGDPRADLMHEMALKLSNNPEVPGRNSAMIKIAERIVKDMKQRKNIYPNVDFYAAVLYWQLGIPPSQYTVIFSMGRIAGWTAHIREQVEEAKLIRPRSLYDGVPTRSP